MSSSKRQVRSSLGESWRQIAALQTNLKTFDTPDGKRGERVAAQLDAARSALYSARDALLAQHHAIDALAREVLEIRNREYAHYQELRQLLEQVLRQSPGE